MKPTPSAGLHLKTWLTSYDSKVLAMLGLFLGLAAFATIAVNFFVANQKLDSRANALVQLAFTKNNLETSYSSQIASLSAELTALKAVDEHVRNEALAATISHIEKTYGQAVAVYEDLVKLQDQTSATDKHEAIFTKALVYLKDQNYASASAQLALLEVQIKDTQAKLAASGNPPENVVADNNLNASGYKTQWVNSPVGLFRTGIVAADLASTKVIVDTASDGNCSNDCPVLPLATYVSRSGAFAGINGSYFCPASYPSCAGKTNSFDTLLMNKNKTYFNGDNNVYSTVPVAVFGGGWARFIGRSLEWGRDTGVDAVIANQPLMVSGGQVVFGGDGDPKKGSKSNRSFVGSRGGSVYIGVVFNSTVAEAAHVLKTLGLDNALNLDSGGSTALWYGGYKAGPGRNIPNAILFVRR